MGFLFLISLRVEDNSVFFENYLVYSFHKQEVSFVFVFVCLCVYVFVSIELWWLTLSENARMKNVY